MNGFMAKSSRLGVVAPLLLMMSISIYAAEEVTTIGAILVNPSAFHRRAVMLQGVAKNLASYSDQERVTNQPLCGYDFTLEDETGAIEVLYHVRCQAGEERAVTLAEGEQVVIGGSIDAPPTNIRTFEGKDHGFRALASKITRPKK